MSQPKEKVLLGAGHHVPAPPAESSKRQQSFNSCINAQPMIIELNATPAAPTPLVIAQDETGKTIQAEGAIAGVHFKNPDRG